MEKEKNQVVVFILSVTSNKACDVFTYGGFENYGAVKVDYFQHLLLFYIMAN